MLYHFVYGTALPPVGTAPTPVKLTAVGTAGNSTGAGSGAPAKSAKSVMLGQLGSVTVRIVLTRIASWYW